MLPHNTKCACTHGWNRTRANAPCSVDVDADSALISAELMSFSPSSNKDTGSGADETRKHTPADHERLTESALTTVCGRAVAHTHTTRNANATIDKSKVSHRRIQANAYAEDVIAMQIRTTNVDQDLHHHFPQRSICKWNRRSQCGAGTTDTSSLLLPFLLYC